MNTRWLLKRSGDAPDAVFAPRKHKVHIIPQAVAKAFVLRVSTIPVTTRTDGL